MCDIYGGVDRSALDDWKTVLAKGGTGTLVIQTENTYSGGSDLHGGLTVMQTQKALGTGAVNMAYGAGLMLDYVSDEHTGESDPQKGELQEARFLNSLTVTHMLDFADKPQYMATGDAQLFNRWDTAAVVETLISYSGAKLTLRGVSWTNQTRKPASRKKAAVMPSSTHTQILPSRTRARLMVSSVWMATCGVPRQKTSIPTLTGAS